MNPHAWRLYALVLQLLPRQFRHHYAQQILQTARDAAAGEPRNKLNVASLFADLARIILQENTRMLTAHIARRPFFYQAVWLSAAALILALGGYAFMQQTIRRAANHPQHEMAAEAAALLTQGADPAQVAADRGIDFSHSLEPFLIVYDEQGHAIASQAKSGGIAPPPAPPAGVLLHARTQGLNELTWQPRKGVRLATTTLHYGGAHPGYVLAARSLETAEHGELIAREAALFGWLGVVALLLLSAVFFSHAHQRQQHA